MNATDKNTIMVTCAKGLSEILQGEIKSLGKHFQCGDPEKLYSETTSLPWEQIISPAEYVCVIGRIETPTIENTMFANLKIKDAIVDRIMQKTGARPNSGKERSNVVVQAYWKNDKCWIYLNTSGQKVSDRNYRKIPCAAPLRESLAAADLPHVRQRNTGH
ncbi:MAG: THUMP domain-containing protein [Planctomycetota bacterium]|jgi:putative N6-adenine-specific DNA methylase